MKCQWEESTQQRAHSLRTFTGSKILGIIYDSGMEWKCSCLGQTRMVTGTIPQAKNAAILFLHEIVSALKDVTKELLVPTQFYISDVNGAYLNVRHGEKDFDATGYHPFTHCDMDWKEFPDQVTAAAYAGAHLSAFKELKVVYRTPGEAEVVVAAI